MTEEQIKQNAKKYVENKGKEHFRKFYDEQLSMADLLKTCCMEFATEVTKELLEEVEDWKADHEYNLELMKGLNKRILFLEDKNKKCIDYIIAELRALKNTGRVNIGLIKRVEDFLKEY